jgi:hypothetical protein
MWNGETESSGTTQQEGDYQIITPEILLAKVVDERDTAKAMAETYARALANRDLIITNVVAQVEEIIEGESLTDSYTQVDTDHLRSLCELLSIELETEISITIEVDVTLTVPRGTTARDVKNDIDSYIEVSVTSADDTTTVEDFSINY